MSIPLPSVLYDALVREGQIERDPQQAEAAEQLDRLHDALADYRPARFSLFGKEEPPRGLYLWGGVGTGKSLLMDLFFENAPVPSDEKRRVHFHAFCQEAQGLIRDWRGMDESARRKADHRARRAPLDDPIPHVAKKLATEARLLCFDEFQVTDVADAMILSRLFEGLWERGAVILATSNRQPDDLYKNGINRRLFLPFIEEMKARCVVHRLDAGRDYRLEREDGVRVYHHPLGPEAEAAMQACWHAHLDGAEASPAILSVHGRQVAIPLAHASAMRAGFADLCETPLGPGDALAIARGYATVFLDNIPILTPEHRNEAKRFVTLIDALYEHRCQLVCSAAARPDALYPQGHGSFEFQRTASRLEEMRSESYLEEAHRPG